MNTAEIILDQMHAIDPMALLSWGARDLVNMGDGIKFRTSGMTPYKGYVYIRYRAGPDAYEIQFFRVRKSQIKMHRVVPEVYAPELVSVIDGVVG